MSIEIANGYVDAEKCVFLFIGNKSFNIITSLQAGVSLKMRDTRFFISSFYFFY